MFRLTSNTKLKIWTIVTHAFIIVGFGHGIATFLVIEIWGFPYFTNKHFNIVFNSSFESHLPIVGLTTLLGQASLAYSILIKKQPLKIMSHLMGVVFLWLSIIYFTVNTEKDYYVHFATFSCVPFAICTALIFIGRVLRKLYSLLYNWIFEIDNVSK